MSRRHVTAAQTSPTVPFALLAPPTEICKAGIPAEHRPVQYFFNSLFERPCAKYKRKYARVSKTANYTHGQTSEEAIELYNGGHLNVYGTTCQHISINTSKRWPIYI